MADPEWLCLLGPPVRQQGNRSVALTPSKPHALALILASKVGERVSRSRLMLMLWEDLGESEGRRALSTTLTRLRQGWPRLPIRAEGDYLTWEVSAEAIVDTWQFEQWLREGRLEEAAGLWRGPFLDGFHLSAGEAYEEWVEEERQRWRRRLLDAWESLAVQAEAAGDWERLKRYAQAALAVEPLGERMFRRLMRARYLSGDRTGALASYHRFRDRLVDELGVEPEPDTVTLADALSDGRTLAPASPRSTVAAVARWQGMLGRARFSCFGREEPLTRLAYHLKAAWADEEARIIVLQGDQGIGKTRVLQELLNADRVRPGSVLAGHCYETAVELPYGPIVEAIGRLGPLEALATRLPGEVVRQLAALLPGMADPEMPTTAADAGGTGRLRLYEALVHLITGLPGPLLLLVEDLQWADEATLQFLAYLVRHPRAGRLAMLVTVRQRELPEPVEQLLWRLEYEGRAHRVDLGPVSAEASASLAHAVGLEDPVLVERVVAEAQGNPLFTIWCAEAMAERAALAAGEDEPEAVAIPTAVQRLVAARFRQLPAPVQEVARAAAIFPYPIPMEALLAVAEPAAEVAASVKRLTEGGMLEFVEGFPAGLEGGAKLRFGHDLIRRAVLSEVAPARQVQLHRQAFAYWAATVAARAAEKVNRSTMEALAFHASRGEMAAEAVSWSLRAADASEAVFAYADAHRFLRQALAHLHRLPSTVERFRVGIDVRLRLAEMGLSSRPSELVEWVSQATAAAVDAGHRAVEAQVLQAIALGLQGKLPRAVETLRRLLRFARRQGNPGLTAISLMYLGQLLGLEGSFPASAAMLEEAIPMLEGMGRQRDADYSRCTWATVVGALGRIDEALAALRMVAAQSLARGNLATAAYAYCHIAVTLHQRAAWAEVLAAADEAIRLSRRERQLLHEYVARVFQGVPTARTGDLEGGIRRQEAAIALGESIRLRLLLDRSYAMLASLRLQAGDLPGARQAAVTGLQIARADGYRLGIAVTTKALGAVELADGNAGGLRLVEEAMSRMLELSVVPMAGRCHALLAVASPEGAVRERHRRHAESIFEAMKMPRDQQQLAEQWRRGPDHLRPADLAWWS